MASQKWFLVALMALALASGCSSFNTNLTTQTNSSNVTFISPTNVKVGSDANGNPCPATGTCFTLTVMGAGFTNVAEIQWTTSTGVSVFPTCSAAIASATTCATPACVSLTAPNCTTFVSSTELQATITAADVAGPAGTIQVAVALPGSSASGASSSSSSNTTELSNFVLFNLGTAAASPPTITTLSPPNIGAGSSGFTLNVTGTGFVSGASASVLYWNGAPQTTTVTSATSLSAPIAANLVASVGTANVSVSNAASGGSVSNPPTIFAITSAAPTIAARIATVNTASSAPGVTSNGRYVVFAMASTDGVTEHPGTTQNVFVRDTCQSAPAGCTSSTSLISVGIDGHTGDADSTSPSISADGRYVAFVSSATNLIDGDTSSVADVFVRDTCAGAPAGCTATTQRVSVASDGTPANGASQAAAISASGRYVTFNSQATNLDPASSTGSTGFSGIFVRDTCVAAPAGCSPSTQLVNLQN